MNGLKACEAGGYSIERRGDFAFARVLRQVEGCPDCGGTGLLRGTVQDYGRAYEVATPCPRRRMTERAELYNRARIPAVHATSTFDSYRASTAEVHRGLSIAKDFALRYPQERGFILSGPVGTGKTHLLAATLRHLLLELAIRN